MENQVSQVPQGSIMTWWHSIKNQFFLRVGTAAGHGTVQWPSFSDKSLPLLNGLAQEHGRAPLNQLSRIRARSSEMPMQIKAYHASLSASRRWASSYRFLLAYCIVALVHDARCINCGRRGRWRPTWRLDIFRLFTTNIPPL